MFRLDSNHFKNLSDTERSTFHSGAEQYCSGAETASKAAFLVWTEAVTSATLRFITRYSVNIASFSVGRTAILTRDLKTNKMLFEALAMFYCKVHTES